VRLYRQQQLLERLIRRLGGGVPTCILILGTRHRVLRSQGVTHRRKKKRERQQTYDLFAFFDTGFNLGNVALGNIIFLFYLVFSEDL
jgi:hypothetical protein